MFTVGHIEFSKTVISKPIYYLFSTLLSIGITKKQALLTHFDDGIFDVMRNVIPLRAHSTAPIGSPKTTYSSCSKISVLLCWNLPSHHTVTISDDTPLTLDAGALHNDMDALGYAN